MMTNEMCAAALTSVNKVWLEIKIMSEFKYLDFGFLRLSHGLSAGRTKSRVVGARSIIK